jgi:hypothetical protein
VIRMHLNALSADGQAIADSLKAREEDLNRQCSCPEGESCSVELVELPGKRFEAIVVRPRPVQESREWTAHAAVSGMYRRLFDPSTTANRILDAVAKIVGATLAERTPNPGESEGSDGFRMIVVDSVTLQRAQKLIVRCQVCSPFYAEIPFDSILDRVTGNDPSRTRYVVAEGTAKCPRCRRHLRENTLVEFEPPFHRK